MCGKDETAGREFKTMSKKNANIILDVKNMLKSLERITEEENQKIETLRYRMKKEKEEIKREREEWNKERE